MDQATNSNEVRDLVTCNETLRQTYLVRKSEEFKLQAEKDGYKEWLEDQERYGLHKAKVTHLKAKIGLLGDEMTRLAALGEQYELGLDV